MKLDHDCVREILLELEEKLTLNDQLNTSEVRELQTVQKFGEETSFYAILKLIDANFIEGKAIRSDDSLSGLILGHLTWDGHVFLDNIRETSIWEATKEKTKGLASISVSLMAGIAQDYLKQRLGLN
ncbi:DUF2513 domain-containing protein [Bacillus sp. WMMC1349]|uniref:DUF2513 domain-containing protein n=1 Tax=Bacillus sp. WMMC1349 TaxID=2736254 RepID=UPI001555CEBF|nr:DUF2513 domain-containing protein [Bacillus sp. WMMC1349]NPC90989.1 DUF2513 domain-containing protein [Bacillus sp. WMMC1349]NPC91034.1 DUF2513 domain-containing protein [Bacillus sp. WMMC1349]NPC94973.1 DUF2513 domain-containing protein [Bacillus sp. WMMC1349]NPC95039.1 DUF2513 domain-containing protein [Bacillus sp. WMMC1349]NPC95073.1 DUF2513 domain-containing protein [Bacillus sp. WMMC1349]